MTFALVAIAAAVAAFVATMAFLNWKAGSTVRQTVVQQSGVTIQRPEPARPPMPGGSIDVIDGDTVRYAGSTYRLVGFDTPETGRKARCEAEHAEAGSPCAS